MSAAAFEVFDRDHDGFITAHEMIEILVSGSDMSESDAADYFRIFDKDEDEQLSPKEFEEAWSMFGSFLQSTLSKWNFKMVEKTKEAYETVVAPYADKISTIFLKLDLDGDGA